jgi:hypothetical protein
MGEELEAARRKRISENAPNLFIKASRRVGGPEHATPKCVCLGKGLQSQRQPRSRCGRALVEHVSSCGLDSQPHKKKKIKFK